MFPPLSIAPLLPIYPLHIQLMPQGIPVSIVKPGPVVTNIWETARRGSDAAQVPPEAQQLYGDLITRVSRVTPGEPG